MVNTVVQGHGPEIWPTARLQSIHDLTYTRTQAAVRDGSQESGYNNILHFSESLQQVRFEFM